MILTALPDVAPRPLTSANAAFRETFYRRWGRENALVCGHAEAAEFAPYTQTLSVKAAWGGRERYQVGARRLAVDDDHYAVLPEGSRYGSRIEPLRPGQRAFSLAVFFAPGLAGEVAACRAQSPGAALARPDPAPRAIDFDAGLHPNDDRVSPMLQVLRAESQQPGADQLWLDDRCIVLLSALLSSHPARSRMPGGAATALTPARATARAELQRRLRLAFELIEDGYDRSLTLDDLASAACLSRYHFVRHFSAAYGLPPCTMLARKRARVARRLLDSGESDREAVAQRCGFGSRFALARALRRHPA